MKKECFELLAERQQRRWGRDRWRKDEGCSAPYASWQRITLLAFARRTRLLLSAGRAAIVVLQVCCCEPVLGLTDRRTPYHCIDPAAPYTVRTVPIIEVSLHARLRSRESPGYATDTYEVSLVRLLASSGDCTVVRLCRRDVFRTIRQGALLTSTMHSIIQIRQSLTCEH